MCETVVLTSIASRGPIRDRCWSLKLKGLEASLRDGASRKSERMWSVRRGEDEAGRPPSEDVRA